MVPARKPARGSRLKRGLRHGIFGEPDRKADKILCESRAVFEMFYYNYFMELYLQALRFTSMKRQNKVRIYE